MPNAPMTAGEIAHAIELALSPALLLVGIGGILAVMTTRLDRIVDRGRQLTEERVSCERLGSEVIQHKLESLERRRHLASAAIASSTSSALFLCMVIAALFIEALLGVQLGWLLGVLFTCSTVAMVASLAYFLAEVRVAARTVIIPVRLTRNAVEV